MTAHRTILVLAVVAGLGPAAAFAQTAPPPATAGMQTGVAIDGGGVPFRRWDVAVSAGLHVDRDEDTTQPNNAYYDGDEWRPGLGAQIDIGRYWTSHLKTEVSYAYLTSHDIYGSQPVLVPAGVAIASVKTDVARQYAGVAMTYQFLDNTFAHPYVSGGVRASVYDRHSVRAPTVWYSDRTTSREYPVPPLDVRERDVLVRPYVAAGFKSYFDERAFIRSEVSTAFSDRGPTHWALRLGAGIDF